MDKASDLPFLQPLYTLRIQFLHSYNDPNPTLCWIQCFLINPSLVDPAKSSFPENWFRFEIPSGTLQFSKGKYPEIWNLEDLAFQTYIFNIPNAAAYRLPQSSARQSIRYRNALAAGLLCRSTCVPRKQETKMKPWSSVSKRAFWCLNIQHCEQE